MALYLVSELEGVAEVLSNSIEKLTDAEAEAKKRGGAALAEDIRSWRLVLEKIMSGIRNVIEDANRGSLLAAQQDACMLEDAIRRILLTIDSYRPISTGYERLLISIQEVASRLCRG